MYVCITVSVPNIPNLRFQWSPSIGTGPAPRCLCLVKVLGLEVCGARVSWQCRCYRPLTVPYTYIWVSLTVPTLPSPLTAEIGAKIYCVKAEQHWSGPPRGCGTGQRAPTWLWQLLGAFGHVFGIESVEERRWFWLCVYLYVYTYIYIQRWSCQGSRIEEKMVFSRF